MDLAITKVFSPSQLRLFLPVDSAVDLVRLQSLFKTGNIHRVLFLDQHKVGWGAGCHSATGQQEQHTWWCSSLEERAACTGHWLGHQAPAIIDHVWEPKKSTRKGHLLQGTKKVPDSLVLHPYEGIFDSPG